MSPKYLMELLTEKKISRLGLGSANKNKLLTIPNTVRKKHLLQEILGSMDQLYGSTYQTISGYQQTIIPSKENLKHTYFKLAFK